MCVWVGTDLPGHSGHRKKGDRKKLTLMKEDTNSKTFFPPAHSESEALLFAGWDMGTLL